MEDYYYNILWIDDEHEKLSGTKGRAKRNGINLIPFKSLDGGMNELERNYSKYDGVLLDAKFFENEDDEAGTEDTYASISAQKRISQLPKRFEIFVLTGQAEVYEDSTYKKFFEKVYHKGNDADIEKLFLDIKEFANKQSETQLRYYYKRVFDVCTERYIGELAGQDVLNLLKIGDEYSIESDFNTIRKIVEDIFKAFHKYNLLPLEFVKPKVALNESSKFLAGKTSEKGYQHLEETHLPVQIANCMKSILAVTQAGSHRSNIDREVKLLRTPYLFKSVLYQLMHVLVWFKMYIDGSPKIYNWKRIETDINPQEWNSELIYGKVLNYNIKKGYAFFKPNNRDTSIYIPPRLVLIYNLVNGKTISAEIEEYTDQRSGNKKMRVKKIQE